MNYLDIILKSNSYDDKRLIRYLSSELQNAKKEYFTEIEFFDACLNQIANLKNIVHLLDEEKKHQLFSMIQKEYEKDLKSQNNSILPLKSEVNLRIFQSSMEARNYSTHITDEALNRIKSVIEKEKKKTIIVIGEDSNLITTERENKLLQRYIWKDKHSDFKIINKKFMIYWNENRKIKKDLIYYLHFLIGKDYFKKNIDGKIFKPRYGKDFLSLYFYQDKLSLSEAKKNYFKKITAKNNHLYTILSL